MMGRSDETMTLECAGRLRLVVVFCFVCIGGVSQVASFELCDSRKRKGLTHTLMVGGVHPLWLFESDTEEMQPVSTNQVAPRPHRVHFASPLLDYGYPPTVQELRSNTLSQKPILLYLPGFDGTDICPFIQYPELGTEFDVWCMSVGMDDRSTFEELKWSVLDFIENMGQAVEQSTKISEATPLKDDDDALVSEAGKTPTESAGQPFWISLFSPGSGTSPTPTKSRRPIYLAGESFGGLLASEVALTLLKGAADGTTASSTTTVDLKGLVLINPATCYDRSQLAAKGPPVANLPPLLYPFGLLGLLPLFTDEYSFAQLLLILSAKALPSVIDDPLRESFMGRVAFSLPLKLEYMSQGTLKWRLEEWLDVGCERMESLISDFQDYPSLRTLILVGEKDLTLPSIAEAERLVNLLPKSQVHVVEGAGHASTCGSRVDMTAQMRKAFPELLKGSNLHKTSSKKIYETDTKRRAMKPEAAQGVGPYFGMEPRYDGANIGLSPIVYWSKENFQALRKVNAKRQVVVADDQTTPTVYTQASYNCENKTINL